MRQRTGNVCRRNSIVGYALDENTEDDDWVPYTETQQGRQCFLQVLDPKGTRCGGCGVRQLGLQRLNSVGLSVKTNLWRIGLIQDLLFDTI